jgi:diadenosine tetraphosphate (Ap4A) HIT family hydrolase
MNPTLDRFGHPGSFVRELEHWVVLIRPVQPTPFSCIIAAKSSVTSLGDLGAEEGAELPFVIRGFESAVRRTAPAVKFNYFALMMVDPNPHFHAVPRYAAPVSLEGSEYPDEAYPGPPNILHGLEVTEAVRDRWRGLLADHWPF